MPNKKLDDLIAKSHPGQLEVTRGPGLIFSTEKPVEEAKPAPAAPKPPQVARESAKVDKRLIKEYKLIAAQQDRNLYEVMEEALRYWLDFHNSTNGKIE